MDANIHNDKLARLRHGLKSFLARRSCRIIPNCLFARACDPQFEWNRHTGMQSRRFPETAGIPSWLRFCGSHEVTHMITSEFGAGPTHVRQHAYDNIDLSYEDLLREDIDALCIFAHALPDPFAEVGWEEIDYLLWPCIISECLPIIIREDAMNLMRSSRRLVEENIARFLMRILCYLPQGLAKDRIIRTNRHFLAGQYSPQLGLLGKPRDCWWELYRESEHPTTALFILASGEVPIDPIPVPKRSFDASEQLAMPDMVFLLLELMQSNWQTVLEPTQRINWQALAIAGLFCSTKGRKIEALRLLSNALELYFSRMGGFSSLGRPHGETLGMALANTNSLCLVIAEYAILCGSGLTDTDHDEGVIFKSLYAYCIDSYQSHASMPRLHSLELALADYFLKTGDLERAKPLLEFVCKSFNRTPEAEEYISASLRLSKIGRRQGNSMAEYLHATVSILDVLPQESRLLVLEELSYSIMSVDQKNMANAVESIGSLDGIHSIEIRTQQDERRVQALLSYKEHLSQRMLDHEESIKSMTKAEEASKESELLPSRVSTPLSQAGLHLEIPAPNPSADTGLIPTISSPEDDIPTPLLTDSKWDPASLRPEAAIKVLCRAVVALAETTGDIPPSPPISRPGNPSAPPAFKLSSGVRSHSGSRPATPVLLDNFKGSPEAHHEPSTRDVGVDAEPVHFQQIAIARKFYSKKPPPISLLDYLMRLQRYCPMSTAVYLTAASYIYKLAVEDKLIPVTKRTVHRLLLGTLRVAMKALEDLRYPQARFAGVGGVRENELQRLEISVCYLMEFKLQVTPESLKYNIMRLQQVGTQAGSYHTKTPTLTMPKITGTAGKEVDAAQG